MRQAEALPPLGLTLVDSTAPEFGYAKLSVIDDTAYISTRNGLWHVNRSGESMLTPIIHSELGAATSITPVIKAFDNQLYLAGNFVDPVTSAPTGALFQINSPSPEIVSWPDAGYLVGIDENLRAVGNVYVDSENGGAYVFRYSPDGSVVRLAEPEPTPTGMRSCCQYASEVSTGGFVGGEVHEPGSIGLVSAIWNPEGSFSYGSIGTGVGSIAERSDGRGLNYADAYSAFFVLGEAAHEFFRDSDGNPLNIYEGALVSHGDFVIAHESTYPARVTDERYGYFPGIVPQDPYAAVNLEKLFPELATLDYLGISDLYSIENRVYMTLHGPSGIHLFGGIDPSTVPEPAAAVLILAGLFMGSCSCRTRS
ncbi:hypothetical protein [Adhaeretor mobilis]|uniref:PEP-CTERM protein-sorting domain-containing protein n=1 Tax=Adhaeretor mobilis TaxID=1930276 RepID=A0A517MPP6_9BACT|nr:hypothetical protein [Adhaeretor mobilis]QDS96858.1 hypothetical protein HG15A2_01160 [Adhaeretor mobilis]